MIIDTHTHIFDEGTYQTYAKKARGRIGKILSIYFWLRLHEVKPSSQTLENFLAFAAKKKNLFVVGAVDVNRHIGEQLKKLEALLQKRKIVGIKLYPGYQRFYVTDRKVFPVIELCQKYHVPLIIHSGDVFDRFGTAELKYSHPIYIDSLAVRFPRCPIVIAHFGFPYHVETAMTVSKNENVFTDISGTIDRPFEHQNGKDLLNQYIRDLNRAFAYFPNIKNKVLFGTDYGGESTPLNQIEPYIKLVHTVFSKKERDFVFFKLAERLFFSKREK